MREGDFQNLITCQMRAESRFNPRAVSRCGAKGLMQLMDPTGMELYRELLSSKTYDPFEPDLNRMLGSRYMRRLLEAHDVGMALVAYNWGPGNLDEAMKEVAKNPSPASLKALEARDLYRFIFIKLPKETKEYVERIRRYWVQTGGPDIGLPDMGVVLPEDGKR